MLTNCQARGGGAPAKSGRIAYGSLLIKERLGITDEETVEQISENPYLQYFLGLRELLSKALFDPSMMVHFRSRFSQEDHQRINASIIPAPSGIEAQKNEDPKMPRHLKSRGCWNTKMKSIVLRSKASLVTVSAKEHSGE